MTPSLAGRNAVVTGGSHGLGREIARAYLQAGANVLICSRDASDLANAHQALETDVRPGRMIVSEPGDVSVPDDVDRIVARALATFGTVEVLVNNAGVYGPMGPSETVDWAEWTRAVEINLHGSVLPCRALVPHFKQRRYGKIIQISGGGATNPLARISAYAASKAAVVRFAECLADEVRGDHIDVNAIAPGALNTRLLDQALASGPTAVGAAFHARMQQIKAEGGTPFRHGADLAVFLASAASDGITGRLISAVWDPWRALPERRDELMASDVYTLRRIVPVDRGKNWDNA